MAVDTFPCPTASLPLEVTAGSASLEGYQRLFVAHTVRSADLALRQLQEAPSAAPPELRTQALLTLRFALRLPEAWSSARAMLLKLAPMMEQAGLWDEWMPFLEAGIARSRTVNDMATQAELQVCLGNLRRRQSAFAEASDLLHSAADCFQALNLPERRAVALTHLANVARTQRDYGRAKRLVHTALALLPPNHPDRAYCYFVQGQIAIECIEHKAALTALHQAHALAEQHGDMRIRALALLNLGRVYEQEENFAAAIEHYVRAITLLESNQNPVDLAVAQMNLGLVYMGAEEPGQALRYYRQAESTLRQLGDRRYLAMVYNNLGMLYRDQEQWAEAEEALHAGIAIWRDLGDPLARINVQGNLAIAYLRQGQYLQAVQLLEQLLDELETMDPASAEGQKLFSCLLPYLQEAHRQCGGERVSRQSRRKTVDGSC